MSAIEHIPGLTDNTDLGLLRFITCGSVDDGKSTLIGRLLYDSKGILADTLNAISQTSARRGLSTVDLSLLTDGLQAEREQGITIDVAYRYFSTGRRKYIVADAPGHEQYTRNMVTAASTANLAIILVDARKGVLTQTRRHATIAHLLGVPHLVVAVNKMDLVAYDQARFEEIRQEFQVFADNLGIRQLHFVPLCALNGDMLVERGDQLSWYAGPTLFELLENAPANDSQEDARLRLPVQYVCRPQTTEHHDYRGYMGRIESGELVVGDELTVLPSGQKSRVKTLELLDQTLARAQAGQSVSVLLEDDIDISRGDLLVKVGEEPRITRELTAMLCWLAETPLDGRRMYLLRHTTRDSKMKLAAIDYRLDVNTLAKEHATALTMNDIARVQLKLTQPVCCDAYADNRASGAFIIIDEATNNTVGAGMIIGE